VGLPN